MYLQEFYQKYPATGVRLSTGKDFTYRYYENPAAKSTLVLLTGGIGLSDLFYLHFERFAKDFSVMTFDYQVQFAGNREFAAAVAELLERLGIKAWLVGQSLGGIVAQIIAKNHPEVVEGLVLSNTCSLARDMGDEAYTHLMGMIESEEKSKRLLKWMPFSLFKRLINILVLFLLHAIAGGFQMLGVGNTALKAVSWVTMSLIAIHIIIGIKLTADTLIAQRKAGVAYFKENKLFWVRRLSGFAVMLLLFFHFTAFGYYIGDAYRLRWFTFGKLTTQILLVIALAVHVISNIRPVIISFGIKSLKQWIGDILIVLSALLLFMATAFVVYFLRWNVL